MEQETPHDPVMGLKAASLLLWIEGILLLLGIILVTVLAIQAGAADISVVLALGYVLAGLLCASGYWVGQGRWFGGLLGAGLMVLLTVSALMLPNSPGVAGWALIVVNVITMMIILVNWNQFR